jgi:hypothetical protein
VLAECYAAARTQAALETGLQESTVPDMCPFDLDHVLDLRWLPTDRM